MAFSLPSNGLARDVWSFRVLYGIDMLRDRTFLDPSPRQPLPSAHWIPLHGGDSVGEI